MVKIHSEARVVNKKLRIILRVSFFSMASPLSVSFVLQICAYKNYIVKKNFVKEFGKIRGGGKTCFFAYTEAFTCGIIQNNGKKTERGDEKMEFAEYFPIWEKMTVKQQERLRGAAQKRQVKSGTVVHNGSMDCLGLMLICSGQFRAFIRSEEGREITIYRLFERDVCLFSASCIMKNIQFEITIEAEKDSEVWVIPPEPYRKLMEESAALANYTNQIMASRFSEVMWLIEQVMWKSFDKRLAGFLLEESALNGSGVLRITHEKIANHMGTAREVVTRMLRYFRNEGILRLTRGTIEIIDFNRLEELRNA